MLTITAPISVLAFIITLLIIILIPACRIIMGVNKWPSYYPFLIFLHHASIGAFLGGVLGVTLKFFGMEMPLVELIMGFAALGAIASLIICWLIDPYSYNVTDP